MAEGSNGFVKSSDAVEQLSLFYGLEAILLDILYVDIGYKLKCINEEEANKLKNIYTPVKIISGLQQIMRAREQIQNKMFTANDYNQVILYLAGK